MTDIIKDSQEAIFWAVHENSFESEEFLSFDDKLLVFLKHLRDNGPDEVMKGKFYWGTIKAFLSHVIKRLEEDNDDGS